MRASIIHVLAWSLVSLGCGSTEEVDPEVRINVEAPATAMGMEIASIDYELACNERWDMVDEAGLFVPANLLSGSLDVVGPTPAAQATLPAPSNTWNVTLEPLSGSCLLRLVARDDMGQELCLDGHAFRTVDTDAVDVRTTLSCEDGASFVSNTTLNVDAPVIPGVQIETVEYTITCSEDGTAFFETIPSLTSDLVIDGSLEVVAAPDGGTAATLDLPPGECSIQLRPRDDAGDVICDVDARFMVRPDVPTDVRLIVLCL